MPKKLIGKFSLSVSVGTGIGILSSAVMIFLMAAALTVGNVPALIISPVTVIFLAVGSFFGGFSAARLFGEKGIVCGAVSGFIFFAAIWISGAFFDVFGIGTAAFIKGAMILISSALGGITGVNYIKRK